MREEKLNIDLESKKYSFIIQSDDVKKVIVKTPIFCAVASKFEKDENDQYNLKIFDRAAGHYLLNRKVKYSTSLNPISKKIRIIVPQNWISNLNINLENGNLLLKDIILDKVIADTVKGNVNVKSCYAEKLDIRGVESDITLENVNGNLASIKTITGDLVYDLNTFVESTYITGTGNIKTTFDKHNLNGLSIYVENKKRFVKSDNSKKLVKKELHFTSCYGKVKSNIF